MADCSATGLHSRYTVWRFFLNKEAFTFKTVMGSDLKRDGMYLELIDEVSGDEVAEVFYSDSTGEMNISVFRPGLPLVAVEHLIAEAKVRLLPTRSR